MARTLDDVLARRVRLQYIDAREAQKVAPQVAQIMATEMQKDKAWIDKQLQDYDEILKNFIIP